MSGELDSDEYVVSRAGDGRHDGGGGGGMAGVQGSGVGLLVKNEEAIRSKAISLCYDRHLQFGSAMIQAWDQRSNLSGYKAPAAAIPFPNGKQRLPTGTAAAHLQSW